MRQPRTQKTAGQRKKKGLEPAYARAHGYRPWDAETKAAVQREYEYIGRLSGQTIRYEAVDLRRLSALSGLSSETLAGTDTKNARPDYDTLIALAIYARRYDPTYSVMRLYRAAGVLAEEDMRRGYQQAIAEITDELVRAGLTPEMQQHLAAHLARMESLEDALGSPDAAPLEAPLDVPEGHSS